MVSHLAADLMLSPSFTNIVSEEPGGVFSTTAELLDELLMLQHPWALLQDIF